MMHSRSRVLLSFVAVLLSIPAATNAADSAYGVLFESDWSTQPEKLVLIDLGTGGIRVVGVLQDEIRDPDLAMLDGVLWMANSKPVGAPEACDEHITELVALSPNTGASLCSNKIMKYPGIPPLDVHVEGLATKSGQLYIGFATCALVDDYVWQTNCLGTVSPLTGDVTLAHAFPNDNQYDFDGLGLDLQEGELHSADAIDAANDSDIYRVKSDGYYNRVGRYFDTTYGPTGFNDLTSDTTRIATVDSYSLPYRIWLIDPVTYAPVAGYPKSIQLGTGQLVWGLAWASLVGDLFNITVAKAPDRVAWNVATTAVNYDVVMGSLSLLRESGGNFQQSAMLCVTDNSNQTEVAWSDVPPPGEAYWIVVRPQPCGTYDGGGVSQVGGRDSEILSSDFGCD